MICLSGRWKIVALFILFGLACDISCTRKEDESKLSIFRGFESDDLKTWDPANAYDNVSLDLVPSVYETLYQYSYLSEVYQLEPLLAAALPQYSSDHLTLTIPIKKGIYFQDDSCFKKTLGKGRELKAQDFVYGMKRLALPAIQSAGWWTVDGKLVGMTQFHENLRHATPENFSDLFEQKIEGLQALDDYTLQLKLLKTDPQLMYILAMSFTAPVAHEAVEAYADGQGNLLEHPIGTGPFKLIKWERNHEVVLDKNPTFRAEYYPKKGRFEYLKTGMLDDAGKHLPFLDRIRIEIVKEAQPRWLNFMKGNEDLIVLPKDNFKQAITDQVNLSPELVKRGIHLNIQTGTVIRYISFNIKDKIVGKNKYLRQALSSSIDREEWISIFTNGTGQKMLNAVPPGILDRPKTTKIKYDFDLTRAKDLLKKAGYPGGQGLPLLKFDLRGASTTDRQLGDFIRQQFTRIGVKVEIIPNTFPAFLEKQKQGNLQIAFGGWQMDYPDAENIYQLLYGPNQSPGPGESNYDNSEFNQLYQKIETMESNSKRAQLIQRMDDLIQEDCPWALGYYEASYDLSQPWLMNYRGSDIITNKYKYYKIHKDIQKRYLDQM